jgi:hypothetical protein
MLCLICNDGIEIKSLGFGTHINCKHHISKIQYVEQFQTEEWVSCPFCGQKYYRATVYQKMNSHCTCGSRECVRKEAKTKGQKALATNLRNGHFAQFSTKESREHRSRKMMEFYKNNPDAIKRVSEQLKRWTSEHRGKLSEFGRLSSKKLKQSGYYESNKFKEQMQNLITAQQLDRINNPQKYKEADKKTEQAKRERGYYDHDKVVARTMRGIPKRIRTNLKKYGATTPFGNEMVRNKFAERYIIKTGYRNPAQNPEVQNLKKRRCLEKYGCEYYTQTDEMKQKTIKTNREKYGVDYYLQSEENRQVCNSPSTHIKRHETMKTNGSYAKSKTEDFLYQLLCRKLPLDWNIFRQYNVKFEIKNLCADFVVKYDDKTIVILVDSYWHGLYKTEQQLINEAQHGARAKIILNTHYRDINFNSWAQQNNVNVLRFDDKNIRALVKDNNINLSPYFSCGDSKILDNTVIKLNNKKFDFFGIEL